MNIKGAEPAVRSPSPAAERMRSYRQRQRRQWRSVRIEISAVEIDALMKRRYLDPENRHDLTAIGEAATACPIRNVMMGGSVEVWGQGLEPGELSSTRAIS